MHNYVFMYKHLKIRHSRSSSMVPCFYNMTFDIFHAFHGQHSFFFMLGKRDCPSGCCKMWLNPLAALINICILRMDQMSVCNVDRVICKDKPDENWT